MITQARQARATTVGTPRSGTVARLAMTVARAAL